MQLFMLNFQCVLHKYFGILGYFLPFWDSCISFLFAVVTCCCSLHINIAYLCRSDQSAVTVTIGGSECDIESVMDTEIVCVTNARKPSTEAPVLAKIGNNGYAKRVSNR